MDLTISGAKQGQLERNSGYATTTPLKFTVMTGKLTEAA